VGWSPEWDLSEIMNILFIPYSWLFRSSRDEIQKRKSLIKRSKNHFEKKEKGRFEMR